MKSKEMNMIIKILGLLGAIFVLIAQFTPWGNGAYLFGADFGFLGFNWFYNSFFTIGVWQYILIAIIMIILFFFNLITLIIGFLAFKKIESRGINLYQRLAILVTVEFIIYIVGFSIAAGGLTSIGIISIGFVMILIAMILYWLTYALGKMLGIYPSPIIQQPPIYQHTQPQMMYSNQQQQIQQNPAPQPAQTQQHQPTEQKAQTPKFCSQCGSPLAPNAKFCPQCGNKL